MKQLYRLIVTLIFALPVFCYGNAAGSVPLDTVEVKTFRDTVYDRDLPHIELELTTYHNFNGSTSIGYSMTLRGEELDITGAELHKGVPESDGKRILHLLSDFHLHAGDSTDLTRIDNVNVLHKFPFSTNFSANDSLVIITDRGNLALYLDEDRRAAAKYTPVLDTMNQKLTTTERMLEQATARTYSIVICIIIIFAVIAIAVCLYIYRYRQKKAREMERLMSLLSENEMSTRQLKSDVTDLMRKHFDTINTLCYEYFEKADTAFVKKSIYNEVEKEIDKLRSPARLAEMERTINKYCDNVMSRIRAQLPTLTENEIVLLVYLYFGLSARTICTLTDIQIKNFYMRRQRLKAKILASDAADRELFVSMM